MRQLYIRIGCNSLQELRPVLGTLVTQVIAEEIKQRRLVIDYGQTYHVLKFGVSKHASKS